MGTALKAVPGNPTATLREALFELLQEGSFRYDAKTRGLIRNAEVALRATKLATAHEKAVGLFCYDKSEHAYMPVKEETGLTKTGEPRPGCEYLFRQPQSLVLTH